MVESRLLTQGSFGKLTMEKTLNTERKIMSELIITLYQGPRESTLLLVCTDIIRCSQKNEEYNLI